MGAWAARGMMDRVERDVDVIESELRLLTAVRRAVTELGATAPSFEPIDELLDERASRSGTQSAPDAPIVRGVPPPAG